MRVELTGRHVEISPGLRRLVERKIQKVQRIVNDAGVSAAVVVTKEKINNVVELSLHARGEQFLHAALDQQGAEAQLRQGEPPPSRFAFRPLGRAPSRSADDGHGAAPCAANRDETAARGGFQIVPRSAGTRIGASGYGSRPARRS